MAEWRTKYSPTASSPMPSFLSGIIGSDNSPPTIQNLLDSVDKNNNDNANNNGNNNGNNSPESKTKKAIIIDNSKFEINSWLTNKTFLSIIAVIVFFLIVIVAAILITRGRGKIMAPNKLPPHNGNGNGNGNEFRDDNDNNDNKGSILAGSGSGGSKGQNSMAGYSNNISDLSKELSKQRSDIKFLFTKLSQHTQKIQHLENLLNQSENKVNN